MVVTLTVNTDGDTDVYRDGDLYRTVAADASLTEILAPASIGPKGQTAPTNRESGWHFGVLTPQRQEAVRAAAGTYFRAGTHTPVKAWKAALNDDWRAALEFVVVPEESEYRRCVTVLGNGEIHTVGSHSDEHDVSPECRAGGRNNRLTRYRFTDGEITCATCVESRRRRDARRIRQAG